MLSKNSIFTPKNNDNNINLYKTKVNINNIDFNIESIHISQERQYSTFGYNNTINNYRIYATTENDNYMKLDNWFSDTIGNNKRDYIENITINGIIFTNIFLIDYTFNQYNIDVTLSFDVASGDLSLLQQKILRKEKLKKILKK